MRWVEIYDASPGVPSDQREGVLIDADRVVCIRPIRNGQRSVLETDYGRSYEIPCGVEQAVELIDPQSTRRPNP